MQHDGLVLTLLWRESRAALRSSSNSDLAWVVLGGGALLAYGVADVVVALIAHADALRQQKGVWTFGLPVAAFVLGRWAGAALCGLAVSRAFAPFLRTLPLSIDARRRMAAVASLVIGIAFAMIVGGVVGGACALIAKPYALVWGAGAAAVFTLGFGSGLVSRLLFGFRDDANVISPQGRWKSFRFPWLGRLDRAGLAWLGSWALNLSAGRVRLTWRLLAIALALGFAAYLSAGASLARHQAAPAAIGGALGGLAVFMLSLRCHPLGSPVLRAAPLSFTRAWLRLLRLPLLLSALFFALPTSVALAAEPSAWMAPAGGALWLLALNGTYAVFAAYFLTTPLVAALSFLAAIAYAIYEYGEFGSTVFVGLAALVLLLWQRARRRFYRG
jgi:hypothetical protein